MISLNKLLLLRKGGNLMFRFTKKEETILLVIIITLVIGSGFIIANYLQERETEASFVAVEADSQMEVTDSSVKINEKQPRKRETKKGKQEILVQIGGEVRRPGVYKLQKGSRIFQVLKKAQGATANADLDRINLAKRLRDEEKVIIPHRPTKASQVKNDGLKAVNSRAKSNQRQTKKINLNLASRSELKKLYRIGPALAQRIIEYRNQHGGFKKIAEIKKVSGIGEKTYQRNKEKLTI